MIWHTDGYDKLKPFGFCIQGCIDGYSRRIIWLEVGVTNNDPDVTAGYFLDAIHSVGRVPRILRADNEMRRSAFFPLSSGVQTRLS